MHRSRYEKIDDSKIIESDIFFINQIFPICYKPVGGDGFISILFMIYENNREQTLYLSTLINLDDKEDEEYFTHNQLYIYNIAANEEATAKYKELASKLNNNTIYSTDFYMIEDEDNKKFFDCKAYRRCDGGNFYELNLRMQREVFIKYSTYIYRLVTRSPFPELPFMDPKYNSMEFITVKYSKLNGTTMDPNTRMCIANYSAGIVPTLYNFNLVSIMHLIGKPIRRNYGPDTFKELHFADDPIIDNIVYDPHSDKVYVLYEDYSKINGEFKKMVVLVYSKEFYTKTNLLSEDYLYNE